MTVSRIRTGVLFILFGVILLLNTTGYLRIDVWQSIATLWPLLLIAIGIEKIFGATERFRSLAYLSPLIIAGTVIYALVAMPNGNLLADFDRDSDRDRGPHRWTVSADRDVELVNVNFDFGGGRLSVRGGSAPNKALEGQFYSRNRKPDLEFERRDGVVDINLTRGGAGDSKFVFSRRNRERWIVKLNETLPMALDVNAGAAQVRLNLEDIICQRLQLSSGAADIDIMLGDKSPEVDCTIDCAAATIDLRVPAGAGVRIDESSALSSLSTDGLDLLERDGVLESPDFESRAVKIMIDVNAGLSSLRIREASRRSLGEGNSI